MKYIHKLFLSGLFLSITFPLTAHIDTLRYFGGEVPQLYLKETGIEQYVQRFTIDNPAVLKQIGLVLTSDSDTGSCMIRVFGQEGGNPYPKYGADICKPQKISKKKRGVEYYWLRVDDETLINKSQFFVTIESLSDGVHPVVSSRESLSECTDNKEHYGMQYLKYPTGDWKELQRSFAIVAIVEYKRAQNSKEYFEYKPEIFSQVNTLKPLKNNHSLSCYDINGDNFIDLLTGGRILINKEGKEFIDQSESLSFNPGTPQINFFIDFDNNGTMDICTIDNEENKSYLFVNDGSTFTRKELNLPHLPFVSTYSLGDVNGDGLTDVFIGQCNLLDSIPDSYLFINKGNGEFLSIDNCVAVPRLLSEGSFLADLNKDGRLELVVANKRIDDISLFTYNDIRRVFEYVKSLKGSKGFVRGLSLANKVGAVPSVLIPITKMENSDDNSGTIVLEDKNISKDHLIFDIEDKVYGGKIIDYDNDNDYDVFVPSACQCRIGDLYDNKDNVFERNTTEKSLYNYSGNKEVLWCDYDNDTDMDVIALKDDSVILVKNNTVERTGRRGTFIQFRDKLGNTITNNVRFSVLQNGKWEEYFSTNGNGIKIQENPYIQIMNTSTLLDSIIVYHDGKKNQYVFTNIKSNGYINLHADDAKERIPDLSTCIENVLPEPQTFTNDLHVEYMLRKKDEITIELFSLKGERVYSQKGIREAGMQRDKISFSQNTVVPSGAYIVRVSCANGSAESLVHCVK